ncbi:MAG: hypothetical protein RLZZ15_2231, partial [Verrucomicrobiota bacterium]
MSATQRDTREHLQRIVGDLPLEAIARRLAPKSHPAPPRVPGATQTDAATLDKRWALLAHAPTARAALAGPEAIAAETFAGHIENFIGTVQLPVGLAGPLRVNGIAAQGDYYVPLATTEAALVASYHRGASVITLAGGCATMVLNEGVSRAPAYAF